MHPNKKINTLLGQLASPSLPMIAPGLERVTALLEALGNPHQHIPEVIHVAGTNGKGSICANLTTIYSQAGLRVHRYTSPHLVVYNERIMVAGELVSDALLRECLEEVVAHIPNHPVTFFEATTAAAFLAFSKVEADLCILEVGLGGRLDATNVIDKPLLTVITPVGYDHQDYLGDDIRDIAAEKAGILKSGIPCVVAQQKPEAAEVIKGHANTLDCRLFDSGGYWRVEGNTYQSERKVIVFDSNLEGEHQLQNAGVTLASVEALNQLKGWDISAKESSKALTEVEWPGRLQQVNLKKSAANIWLDGAHNLMGARALKTWLSEQEAPRTLAIGMLDNRDLDDYLAQLAPLCEQIIGISNFTEAETFSVEEIEQAASKFNLEYSTAKDVNHLLKQVENSKGTVLITGSLYLVGAVLAEI